jgi:hypothetical protein
MAQVLGEEIHRVEGELQAAVKKLEERIGPAVVNEDGPLTRREEVFARATGDHIREEFGKLEAKMADMEERLSGRPVANQAAVPDLETIVNAVIAGVMKELVVLLAQGGPPVNRRPREFTVTHSDGTTSTISETMPDGGYCGGDDDVLPQPLFRP